MTNPLKEILIEYEDIWQDQKRFKALLSDYYPQDKMRRNLLYICAEEKIPEELLDADENNNMNRFRCKNKLTAASGCSEEIADEIVKLWIDALSANQIKKQIQKNPYDYIMALSVNTESPQERLMAAIFGEKKYKFKRIDKGYVFDDEEYDEDVSSPYSWPIEGLSLSDSVYKCLKSHEIDTIRELCCFSRTSLKELEDISKKDLEEIENTLLDKGFQLLEKQGDMFSEYPRHIREIYRKKEDLWQYLLFLEMMIYNLFWLEDYSSSAFEDKFLYEREFKEIEIKYKEAVKNEDIVQIACLKKELIISVSKELMSDFKELQMIQGDQWHQVMEDEDISQLLAYINTIKVLYKSAIKKSKCYFRLSDETDGNFDIFYQLFDNYIYDFSEYKSELREFRDELADSIKAGNDYSALVLHPAMDIENLFEATKDLVDYYEMDEDEIEEEIRWNIVIHQRMREQNAYWANRRDKYTNNELIKIDDLELSFRTYNCLKRAGIDMLGDLADLTVEEMMKIRNLGKQSMDEALEKMKLYGIYPKDSSVADK